MTANTYEWSELSDSRELLEARTPRFITWFLALFVVLIGAGIVWSCTYSIDIVVKAQAVVRPNSRISTVSSNVQGKVTEVDYQPGQRVKKGDVLLRIGLDNMPKQQEDLKTQAAKSANDLSLLQKMEQLAESAVAAEGWDVGASDIGAKWKVSFEQNEYEQAQIRKQLENDTKLRESINQNRNLFGSSESYHEKYEAYRLKVEQLEAALQTAADAYKLQIRTDTEAALGDDNAYANAQRDLDSYKSQYLADLNTSIDSTASQLRGLELERDNLLAQLKTEREALRQQTEELNRQLADANLQIAERTITAPADGVINSVRRYAVGDLIEAGTQLLTIVPEDGTEYVMQLAVANRDIGSVKPGTPVKFDFQALPAKDYGHLSGTVSWLGPDAVTDTDSGQSYYSGEATLQGHVLQDKRGKPAEVKVGMVAEAQMITDREKVIDWLLKKINLKN